jgi:nucleotide-binding universal stress UspA family protein
MLTMRKGAVMNRGEIVVGTDGSASGTAAIRWAAGAAERGGRPLQVVVACHWQVPGRWYGAGGELAAVADERAGGIATDAVAVARSAAPHVEVGCSVLLGAPAPVLLKATEEASMLVVGHRGLGGFSGLLLGSVGMQVATHAPCPVAVVRGRSENILGPVVVGVDTTHPTDSAIALAFEQAAERHCPLHAITAHTVPLPPSPIGIPPLTHEPERVRDELRRQLAQQLASWSAKYPDVAADCEVVEGAPGAVLVDRSRHAQLVVVGTHTRSGLRGMLLGSVGLHLLHHAECPVLIARTR